MKKYLIFISILTVLFLTGCSEGVNTYRTIEEVEIDATSSSGNKLLLVNLAGDSYEYFDIASKSIYHWDLPESYNIQLGTKDKDEKFCMLFNGFKTTAMKEKSTVYIECIDEPIFDLNPRYGDNILNIDISELIETTMETYPSEDISGVFSTITAKPIAAALDDTLPTVRGVSINTFEAETLIKFKDLEITILEKLKKTFNSLYAETKLESKIEKTVEGVDIINIFISIKTPLSLGTVTLTNILSENFFDIYQITKPTKLLSENLWDKKSEDLEIYISIKNQDSLYQKYITEIRVGTPIFGKYLKNLKEDVELGL